MSKKEKPVKIKRSKTTFGNTERNRKIRTTVIWAVALVLVFAGAFFLAKPTMNLISNLIEKARENNVTSSVSGEVDNSLPENPDGEETQSYLGTPHTAVTADISSLQSTEMVIAFAKSLQDQNVKEVILVVKDESGLFYYNSAFATSDDAKASLQVDPSEIVSIFHEHDIAVTAAIYAYQDPLAALANAEWAVQYNGSGGGRWYDNDPANGGKPWLNPYATEVQNYVVNIVKELADLKFDHVIVRAVQYPAVAGLGLTAYGPTESTMTRDEALRTVVTKLNAVGAEKGMVVSVEYPLFAVQEENLVSYIANPITFGQNSMVITMPAMNNGEIWTEAELKAIIDTAKAQGIDDVAIYFTDIAAGDANAATLRSLALNAGCSMVLFG